MFSLSEYRALHEGTGLADRSTVGRFLVTGVDRRTYLQGLLTNDIEALGPGRGCYAAYLTPQGRMLADVRLFETGDSLLALVEPHVAVAVQERWTRFIFSEDVQVADISASTAVLGVYGPRSADALSSALRGAGVAGTPLPAADLLEAMPVLSNLTWDLGGAVHVLRGDEKGVPGFEVVVPVEHRAVFERQLRDAGAVTVGDDTLETTRIEHGRPLFGVDMDEDTIPLEAGIEDRAISLTKGCYVGQEVIIRVLHRGHGRVARRLVGLAFEEASAEPARGDRLWAGDRDVGAITSTAYSPALGRPIALGYVHRDFVAHGTALAAVRGAEAYGARVTATPIVTPGAERLPDA